MLSSNRVPMSSGYAAVFLIAVIFVFVAIVNAAIGNYMVAAAGVIYWGYTAWKMYCRDNESLVVFHRVMLLIQGFAYLTMIAVIAFSGDSSLVGTGQAIFGILAIGGSSMLIGCGLIFLFKRQMPNWLDRKIISANGGSSIDDRYWEAAASEFSSKRNEAVWAKFFSLSEGDEAKAKARYLKSRASDLMREDVGRSLQTSSVGGIPVVNSSSGVGQLWKSLNPFGQIAAIMVFSFIALILLTDKDWAVPSKPEAPSLMYPSSASELRRGIEGRTFEVRNMNSKVIKSNLDVFGRNYGNSGSAMSPDLVSKIEDKNIWWFGSDMRFFIRLHNPSQYKMTGFNFLFLNSACDANGDVQVLVNFDLKDSALDPYSYGLYSSVLPIDAMRDFGGSRKNCGTVKFALVEK